MSKNISTVYENCQAYIELWNLDYSRLNKYQPFAQDFFKLNIMDKAK